MAPIDQGRILDAALAGVTTFGLAKLSMSDVATRAGISRPTLYKHFASKDELIAALVQREAVTIVTAVFAAADAVDDPTLALERAVATALELTRSHPLLDRLVRTEPEALVPLLVTDGVQRPGDGTLTVPVDGGVVLLFVRNTAAALLATKLPGLDEIVQRRLADLIGRLLISYAVSAPDDPPDVVASTIASILISGANSLAPSPSAERTLP